MNTEITDTKDSMGHSVGWIGYDADCGLCVLLADWSRASLERRGFRMMPLQTPWMLARVGLEAGGVFEEMKLVRPDDRVVGGARAVVEIGRHTWWLRPLVWIAAMPGGKRLLKVGYRWIARHRWCANGHCRVPKGITMGERTTS